MRLDYLQTNPAELREAQVLRGWYDDVGKFESSNTLSVGRSGSGGGGSGGELIPIEVAKQPLKNDEARYCSVIGTVVAFRESNAVYKSCGIDDCKKKVLDNGDGTFTCGKCNRPGVTTFTYRYTLSVRSLSSIYISHCYTLGTSIILVDSYATF
jgi:replication factor A1